MKLFWERCRFSFLISAFCGLVVNLLIDFIVGTFFISDFMSISPDFAAMFPTTTVAVYVNVLLYGLIGAAFGGFSVIYESRRLGLILQNLFYFLATTLVWLPITLCLWQLYKYPQALICSLFGYLVPYVIMSVIGYKNLKKNVTEVNLLLEKTKEDEAV